MQANTADILSVLSEAAVAKTIKERKQIFTSNKAMDGLSAFISWVLDPGHNFYMKKVPKEVLVGDTVGSNSSVICLFQVLRRIAWDVRGDEAKNLVRKFYTEGTGSTKALIKIALDRKLPGGIGRSIVNHVWPGLVYKQPYGGCASFDADKIHTRFNWEAGVAIQDKADGMALMLVRQDDLRRREIRTRQGQEVSATMRVLNPLIAQQPDDSVLFVELNLWDGDRVMDRAKSNGIFNSVFKGSDKYQVNPAHVMITVLDYIPAGDFFDGKSDMAMAYRWGKCEQVYNKYLEKHGFAAHGRQVPFVMLPDAAMVYSPEGARDWAQARIKEGKEGAIIKDPAAGWQSKKMTSQMKIKNEFECTLRVIGFKPHSKHKNWVGSLLCESLPNPETGEVIRTYVGSGLNEETGHDLDRRCDYGFHFHRQLVEVRAECITKKNALQLPRIEYMRLDKAQPDTHQEVVDAYNDSTGASDSRHSVLGTT